MSFFKNLGSELGTGTGRGIVGVVSGVCKAISAFLGWLFTWQHHNNEQPVQTNSLRIAVISVLLAFIFVPGLIRCSPGTSTSQNSFTSTSSANSEGKVKVVVNLEKTSMSVFPDKDKFAIQKETDILYYKYIEGKKLYLYHARVDGKPPFIKLGVDTCAAIPAGYKVILISLSPPMFAINMENTVQYVKRNDFLTLGEKIEHFLRLKEELVFMNSWKFVSDNWNAVDYDKYAIVAKALDQSQIDPETGGGVVCF